MRSRPHGPLSRALPMAMLVLASLPAPAAVELVLTDGRVLAGESLERKDELYLLRVEPAGATLVIPSTLVREMRLSLGGPGEPSAPATSDPTIAPSEGGSGPDVSQRPDSKPAAELAPARESVPKPASTRTPGVAEQLAAFGRAPARFARSPTPPTWEYEDVLGYKTDVTQFNPARWPRTSYDPTWTPTSGLPDASPVPNFNPVRWYRPALSPIWYPTSGWD